MERWVIVKHAGTHWNYYFDKDPKRQGVLESDSAHFTHSGKIAGIKDSYTCKKEAKADLAKLREVNPSVSYGVCPVIAT